MTDGEATSIAGAYLYSHGYEIMDRGVMPFRHGLTALDFVGYDKGRGVVVGFQVAARGRGVKAEDIQAEWRYGRSPYFVRATRKWCFNNGWRKGFRADCISVFDDGSVDHIVGTPREAV